MLLWSNRPILQIRIVHILSEGGLQAYSEQQF